MASIDLLFSLTPVTGQPVNLVFGADESVGVAPVDCTITGALPQPELQATLLVGVITDANLSGVLEQPALTALLDVRQVMVAQLAGVLEQPALTASFSADYLTNTARPTVGQVHDDWQVAGHGESGIQDLRQPTLKTPVGCEGAYQRADKTALSTSFAFSESERMRIAQSAKHQTGQRSNTDAGSVYSDAQRSMRRMLANAFQAAERAQVPASRQRHQDGIRTKTSATKGRWQVAEGNRIIGTTGTSSPAMWLIKGWNADHENAMRPPAGMYVPPAQPPGPEVFFSDGHLLFECPPLLGFPLHLVFGAQACYLPPVIVGAVVVPIRRTYVTINSIDLRRVDGNIAIPTYTFSMSLDADSWTWSWSATLPADARPYVTPAANGDPAELEVTINGVAFRLVAEGTGRDRAFANTRIRVRGRGRAAILDAPYAPVLNHGNATDRTAQQLMGDVLTINGIGIGWAIDWRLVDWLVPGNVWSRQGVYIDAILDIAQAAGGYVQPHATAATLIVLPRYPSAPWNWATITPDFELPPAVVSVEGIDWQRKPGYDRVHVSGASQGVLGEVTRTGTAGASVAPMVTHPLITHADAARQRGLAVLSDTGSQARISLKLPVLPETGIITPGKFVRYVDGADTRLGLVRSTSIDWSRPVLRQTIAIETHEA